MAAVYKYFSKQEFVDGFLNDGTVYFNALSYFIACEEVQLRDEQEGSLLFRPADGLKADLISGRQIGMSGAFISRARNSHRIFVFCASQACSASLAQRFKSNYCVEISDADEFCLRLQRKLKSPIYRLRNSELLSGAVNYVDNTEVPSVDHALPERIIFRKQMTFSIEKEHRFAFALDRDAFNAYNVDYSIGEFNASPTKLVRPRIIKIGPTKDFCKQVLDLA